MTTEQERLTATKHGVPWKQWGPYLSERQWGTVREDYSQDGNAWNYLSHDQARSRAYRWGEDGLAGFSDDRQRLCFALALWNGNDPIIKERLFGLTNSESNHGEDVKEYYFYLDSTPTHSYMKYLYKYPQDPFPYNNLVEVSRSRSRQEQEYELIDTGIFDQDRYFDVFVEYAKESPDDILIRITVYNRGPEPAELHVLPTLWFRNTWSWHNNTEKPVLRQVGGAADWSAVEADEASLGRWQFFCEGQAPLLFTENETNTERVFGIPNTSPYVKDSINDCIVHDRTDAVNPERLGTKMAAHYRLTLAAGAPQSFRLRLRKATPETGAQTQAELPAPFGNHFDDVFEARRREADEFYSTVIPASLDTDHALVMRQALAGMLWTKQSYYYDVDRWLEERGADPFNAMRRAGPRNDGWHHMYNSDVISMPDKWEYPWYAAWDLAFHVLGLTLVDLDFGKQQLKMMLREQYMHPNGQVPAYEWNFGDVNPPVHAWSTIFTYRLEKAEKGVGDTEWLRSCFQKLLLNFTWWVNRKDRMGHNVFEGGFLGLDNIGVFDRSAPLPTGGYLEQADGTAWMALFCQNMLEIAMELAQTGVEDADMAIKFCEHFFWIASAMMQVGDNTGMWDEKDGFFYDVLRHPDGRSERLKVRSIVGLLPFCAATTYQGGLLLAHPEYGERLRWFFESRPELCNAIHDPRKTGVDGRRLGSILDETKLRRVLSIMLDENEFLSSYGIRSLSRYHDKHPFVFSAGGQEHRVGYLPAESDTGMFGGNSNWRGPIWMPINVMILRALIQYYLYYGDSFVIECPTGSGRYMTLYQVADELGRRLSNIFLRDSQGRRPVFGGATKFQQDPYWRDCLLFYEYFHGDNGAGLGASHQTGWTGTIARVMHLFATITPEAALARGREKHIEAYPHAMAGAQAES